MAIAMRPLLILVALAALAVSLVLYRFRPGFREWFDASGEEQIRWFRQEIDRLLTTVLGHPTLQPALPDGGTFVDGLYREIDDETWNQLTETFF